MKKILHTLFIATLICFSASVLGMKRNMMTMNNQENQTLANQEKPVIEYLWLDEIIVYLAAHSQPEEKNMLMRICKQFKMCLTHGKDLIIAINPWTITEEECEKALFRTVRVDNAYPDGAGKNAYYLAQRLLDTQLVNIEGMKNILGKTPLHYAQEKNNKIMEDLLKENAISNYSTNASDDSNDSDPSDFYEDFGNKVPNYYINLPNPNITPLQEAVYQGNKKEIKKLLSLEEANPNVALTDGMTLLHIAIHENHTEVIKLLLAADGININQANNDGYTPLHLASKDDHTEIAILLLAADEININQRDNGGNTPIYLALKDGNIEIVTLLLTANGINIHQANNYGNTLLLLASSFDNSEIVKLLLTTDGVNINQANNTGYIPLFLASRHNQPKIVKLLLTTDGININQANTRGSTPLHTASRHNAIEIVKLLLAEDGINTNQANNAGLTALDIALKYNCFELTKLLIAAGAKTSSDNI